MNSYIRTLRLPGLHQEIDWLWGQRQTCFSGHYPFKIFPDKELKQVDFAPITLFYGSNGSGKSTLLNITAELVGAKRHSVFSPGAFFAEYLAMCELSCYRLPECEIITSDDVFEYLLDIRCLNNGIDRQREALFDEFATRKYQSHRLASLDDYDDWKESLDAKRMTRSHYVNERLRKNEKMGSNGESAFSYFIERIEDGKVYLLDEPENSLSVSRQIELCAHIHDAARFFGCQFILATHSPIFLGMEDALIYDLDSIPCRVKKFEELENVRSWFFFFEQHREKFL